MAITRVGVEAMQEALMAFTDDDVRRCLRRAADLEAIIDTEGPDIAIYEEMGLWELLAAKIQARLDVQ